MQLALQALQEPGKAAAVAAAMGTSDSTVSRIKTDRLEEVLIFLSHLGLKVVPAEFKCVEPSAYAFLTQTFERVQSKAPQLMAQKAGVVPRLGPRSMRRPGQVPPRLMGTMPAPGGASCSRVVRSIYATSRENAGMSDLEWARRAVRSLLLQCARSLAARHERDAEALRRWLAKR